MRHRAKHWLVSTAALLAVLVSPADSVLAQEPELRLTSSVCSAPKAVPAEVDPKVATATEMRTYQLQVTAYSQALMDFRECLRESLNRDMEMALKRLPERDQKAVVAGMKAYINLEFEAANQILDVTQKFNAALALYKAKCGSP